MSTAVSTSTEAIQIITHRQRIEARLEPLRDVIGDDFAGYRGHIYRVLTYAMHLLGADHPDAETIETALVYHDVALWTDGQLAYLEPSIERALHDAERAGWSVRPELLRNIIRWHHKVTPFRGPDADVVNAVRRADWIDASRGRLRKGLPGAEIRRVMHGVPPQGFYETLDRLTRELGGSLWGALRQLRHVFKL